MEGEGGGGADVNFCFGGISKFQIAYFNKSEQIPSLEKRLIREKLFLGSGSLKGLPHLLLHSLQSAFTNSITNLTG